MKRTSWILAGLVPLTVLVATVSFDSPWRTPDQAGQRSFRREAFAEAARQFADPEWRAVALFRAGEFESAATLLSGVAGAGAAYNRGNALVFLGKYEDAVESYSRALELRPDWARAETNRRVAASRIRVPEVGEGTGGKLGADGVVFGDTPTEQGASVEVTGGQELSDGSMQELWLRSVEPRPADFLRTKFAYQLSIAKTEGQEDE